MIHLSAHGCLFLRVRRKRFGSYGLKYVRIYWAIMWYTHASVLILKKCFQITTICLVNFPPALGFPSNSLQELRRREDPAALIKHLAQYPRRRKPFWSRPVDMNWNYQPSGRYLISCMCNKSSCRVFVHR